MTDVGYMGGRGRQEKEERRGKGKCRRKVGVGGWLMFLISYMARIKCNTRDNDKPAFSWERGRGGRGGGLMVFTFIH